MRASRSRNAEIETENKTAVENTKSAVENRNEGSKEKMKITVEEKVVKVASGKSLWTKEVAGPADHGTAVLEANERSGNDKAKMNTEKEELDGGKGGDSRENVTRKTLTETEFAKNKREEDPKSKEGAGLAVSGGATDAATIAKMSSREDDGGEEASAGRKTDRKIKHCTEEKEEATKGDGGSSGGVTAGEERTGRGDTGEKKGIIVGAGGVHGGGGADGGNTDGDVGIYGGDEGNTDGARKDKRKKKRNVLKVIQTCWTRGGETDLDS
ncbi:uncharacterized transmembrane protein DDB_G0289901-like [Trematomus bernacchii]|uniref:uncharacterized transmembrane protein DDB_G0289901-like n=1 Tax=Trematomus bernacchii TaxID=40690 RepID=UPI00146A50B2|nr:uncharacterized transmembrane protein DDB_G0289901-like [Trematomus bernacchii]